MINFEMKEVLSIKSSAEAYDVLSRHYMVISPRESITHLRVLHQGSVYGLRSVGSKWVGYKKTDPTDPDAFTLLGQWDGLWDQSFLADTLPEALTCFAYLLQAEGDVREFKELMELASFVKL